MGSLGLHHELDPSSPTGYNWYLVEDTARPLSARPSLPHQIELILAKVTLRRRILPKRGGVATPVESGRSLSPTLHHPMSYVGAILSTIVGNCQPSSQVLQSTTANKSATIALHQTARRRKRPRRRPGRRNVPRAPDPADEAIPSHPLPTMGGHQRQLQPIPRRRVQTIGILVCPCHRLLLLR